MKWIKDRFPLLIIFLIMCCAYAFSVWHYQTGQNYEGSNYSNPVSQSVIPPIHKRIKGISSSKNEREQEQQEKAFFETADHKAQIRMADYALIGILLGFLGSYLLLRTLLYTRDAANAANDTLDVARKTLRLSRDIAQKELRAQVAIKDIKVKPLGEIMAKGSYQIFLKAFLENIGKTPANEVYIDVEHAPWDSGSNSDEIIKGLFKKISKSRKDRITIGHLAAGSDDDYGVTTGSPIVLRMQGGMARHEGPTESDPHLKVISLIRISYRDVFAPHSPVRETFGVLFFYWHRDQWGEDEGPNWSTLRGRSYEKAT